MEIFKPSEQEVLRCGEYLVDEQMNFCEEEIFTCMRIRVIKYVGNLYYHKIIDGDMAEFRRLG